MATSSKFDLSSDSQDRTLYTSGQRGSHLTAQLDRSGSFRESMENPNLSSLPNSTRSSSAVGQGDVVNFFQCLRFDPKVVAAEHKSNRQGDFKRHLNIALGISGDEPPPASLKGKIPVPEEIKRFKAGLKESNVKARERQKIFGEALSVFNKFFPSVPSKKRSRLEGFSNDRTNASLSSDRSVMGPSVGKMGIHNHVGGSGFELDHQKSEERPKNVVPNKRTRTSLVDVRSNALVRPSGTVDRDREMLRLANSGTVQGDDRTLSIGVDGWEKTKMKKKRSGIKPDASPSAVSAKPNDGYRESKQGMQQRPIIEARSRLNGDPQGFRPGVANGTINIGKADGSSQSPGLNVRSSIPRADIDNISPLHDRRERSIGSDKERANLRSVNKSNVRDDFNSASPTSSTKMNASIRGPRTGSGIAPKLSPVVHRATAPNEWELSHCSNKPPAAGVNNRKRTASARSSSPPVAQWAGQRPQKISRAARRTNLIPILSNNDETSPLDTVSDVSGSEPGLGFVKRLTGNSPQHTKLKSDPASSPALSESEESGPPEIKSKEKGRRSDEMDEKAGSNVLKVTTLGLTSRKNKFVSGEDLGDGVRRQGRTGRGFTSRSRLPMSVEKVGNVRTAKQLRSARLGFDKNESKMGRPPTRKLSDRKAYKRQKHSMVNAAADFVVASDDGHEELLAAASAVINPVHACPNPFWRQMEPFFGFITDSDISYLKEQGNVESTASLLACASSDVNNLSTVPNGYELTEHEGAVRLSEQSVPEAKGIPLYQRLIAAMIPDEDCVLGNSDMEFDSYKTGSELDRELGLNGLKHVDNFKFTGHAAFNGYKVTGGDTELDEAEIDASGVPTLGMHRNFSNCVNGLHLDQASIPGLVCPEFLCGDSQITENLLLEVQSIGIYPEPTMEDEGISGEIRSLEDKYREQVSKKKGFLDNLLKSASEAKQLEEKEFDQRAHDKLVAMAYEKYLACRGPSATGGKGSGNKMAKLAAMAFVKRTLERCHTYEDTGKSCFSEPLFRDMFLSRSCHQSGGRSLCTPIDGESGAPNANASSRSIDARVSVSMASHPSPRTSQFIQNGDGFSDSLPPVMRLSEQSSGKEDAWSNRVKKRELLLDDLGTSSAASGIGVPLSSSTKGKRSERDREGKVLSRNGTNKIGRPSLSNVKGERKSKTKPKQKTQLSVSVNGLLGKMPEQPKPALPLEAKSSEISTSSNGKEKGGFGLDALDDPEAIDLSGLQLPGLDDGQGQDLGSWLNIDDDGLQDHDAFMGLEIPMDDLSDLNMMV